MNRILTQFLGYLLKAAIFALLSTGCSYRFANKALSLKTSVRSVAVESVYDTSQEALPHQFLWTEIQKAIAKDGHLRLKKRSKADAIVRIHLISATNTTSGVFDTTNVSERNKDPRVLDFKRFNNPNDAQKADNRNNYRRLDVAGEYTKARNLRYSIKVEVIDLFSRKVLFSKSYSAAAEVKTLRQSPVPLKSHYIIYQEALSNQMRETSASIARRVVQDMLSKL